MDRQKNLVLERKNLDQGVKWLVEKLETNNFRGLVQAIKIFRGCLWDTNKRESLVNER
jgi:hypothetical protein